MEKKNKTGKLLAKAKKNSAKSGRHTQFYYSFLTIILLLCLIQMSFSALLNITKVIAYNRKFSILEDNKIAAEAKNAELKKEIKEFSTKEAMEAIGRNNLKMAGPNEMIIIVNKQPVPEQNKQEKHKKIGFKK